MDANYLQKEVGAALAQALSEVVVKNPEDAIDFIGNYLIKFATDNEELQKAPTKQTNTATIQATAQATTDQQTTIKQSAAAALAQQLQDDEALFTELMEAQARFESPEDGNVKPALGPELRLKTLAVVQKVIDYIKSRTGADACYMGELRAMPDDGPKYLSYSTVGAESQFLVQQNISLGEPEPDEDDAPKPETGAVTWTLFDPIHDEPLPEPEMPEDADPETWVAPVVPPPLPPKVHVQNVLREERMKFYKFPKMGAYLAARLKYNNSIHSGALNEEHLTADPYPEPVEGEEGEEAASEEEGAAAAAEGEEGEAAAEAPVVKKELKIWEANTVEVKGLLAVDTMGSGRPFTPQEELFVQKAAASLSTFLEQMTKHQYQAEVALQRARLASNAAIAEGAEGRVEADAAALETEMTQLQSGGAEEGAAAAAEEGEAAAAEEAAPAAAAEEGSEEAAAEEEAAPAVVEMSEEDKAKHATRIKCTQATTFVASVRTDLVNVLSQLCAPAQGVVDVISSCIELMGIDTSKFTDSTTNQMPWSVLSAGTDVAVVMENLQQMNGDSIKGEACAVWRERLGALDAGDYSGAVSALLGAALALLDHCDACEVLRAAEEAARLAAEEEAAAAKLAAEEEAAAAAAAAAEEEEGGE